MLLIDVFIHNYNNWYMFICISCVAIVFIGLIASLVIGEQKTYEELKNIS